MLQDAKSKGFDHIISWSKHKKAIMRRTLQDQDQQYSPSHPLSFINQN